MTMIVGMKNSWHPRELYSQRIQVLNSSRRLLDIPMDFWSGVRGPGESKAGCFGENFSSYLHHSRFLGACGSKLERYKEYKFAVVYENLRGRPGYFTSEKLFTCFRAGCIPIYWGGENITDYVPPGCFIDRRDFASDEELYSYLRNITENDYSCYCRNMRRYMSSCCPLVFSHNNFVDIFISSFDPYYDRSIVFSPEELHELRIAKRMMRRLGQFPEEEVVRWKDQGL